jgi:hypothetical protein
VVEQRFERAHALASQFNGPRARERRYDVVHCAEQQRSRRALQYIAD